MKAPPATVRQPMDVIAIVDCSDSMAISVDPSVEFSRLDLMRRLLTELTSKLSDDDSFTLVRFSDSWEQLLPPELCTQAGKSHIEMGLQFLATEGGTNMLEAMACLRPLQQASRPNIPTVAFVFTDGWDNLAVADHIPEGLDNSPHQPDHPQCTCPTCIRRYNQTQTQQRENRLLQIVSSVHDMMEQPTTSPMTVHGIACGECDAELMQRISTLGRGTFFYAKDVLNLPACFDRLSEHIANSSILATKLTLRCQAGNKLILPPGSHYAEKQMSPQQVTYNLPPFAPESSRHLLLGYIPAASAEAVKATVTVTFADGRTDTFTHDVTLSIPSEPISHPSINQHAFRIAVSNALLKTSQTGIWDESTVPPIPNAAPKFPVEALKWAQGAAPFLQDIALGLPASLGGPDTVTTADYYAVAMALANEEPMVLTLPAPVNAQTQSRAFQLPNQAAGLGNSAQTATGTSDRTASSGRGSGVGDGAVKVESEEARREALLQRIRGYAVNAMVERGATMEEGERVVDGLSDVRHDANFARKC